LLAAAAAETEKKESEASFVFSRTNPKQVQALQKLLNIAKCEAGLEDGIWGKKTASAVRRFAKTNKLTITSPELIDRNFVETLESQEYISCPPLPKPKPKKLSIISKNWVLSLNCPNGQLSGKASLNYRKTTKSGDEYSISYTNNLGGVYYGFAYATSVSFRFNLKQVNGNSNGKGFGTFSNNRRTVRGRTEDGCTFVAAS
jgi:peptidoglycan hydrolase-like protein with peptidoglycan-binding domain